mmetsp:Transcript_15471/g.32715  ORF Transcript_15471/g.32715 Transcript_15471/m.32715 type:complete len:518 (+) Transcript_15471:100-1653(+)
MMTASFQRRLLTCLIVVCCLVYQLAFVGDIHTHTRSSSACHSVDATGDVGSNSNRQPSWSSSSSSYYPEFDEHGGQLKSNSTFEFRFSNKVVHVAKFGLGHRLSKVGCAWHLAKSLNVTRLELKWNDCRGIDNIFPLLFGSDHVDVPGTEELALEANRTGNINKSLRITNDVDGYYGANNYKWHRVPLSADVYKGEHSPWLEKLDSELQLFKMLRRRFAGKEDAIRFMEEHNFRDRFVIGVHLRLGNDEPLNFVSSGRGVDDQLEFVHNMLDLLRSFLERLQRSHPERFRTCEGRPRRPLIFLATDSPKFIPVIVDDTRLWTFNDTALWGVNDTSRLGSVQTVVMEQLRVDEGVTFYKLTQGEECLRGWREMILDSILLSFSDVLISPRHSSFAQILPVPLVFDRGGGVPGPHFCEMSGSARTMVCLEDMRTWLFRDDKEKMFHYSILNDDDESEPPVVHTLLTHIPDVEVSPHYAEAKKYMEQEDTALTSMEYGAEFSPKYRWRLACPGCTDFTFT